MARSGLSEVGTFEVRTEKQEGGSILQAGGMADGKGKRQKQVWHLLREKEGGVLGAWWRGYKQNDMCRRVSRVASSHRAVNAVVRNADIFSGLVGDFGKFQVR